MNLILPGLYVLAYSAVLVLLARAWVFLSDPLGQKIFVTGGLLALESLASAAALLTASESAFWVLVGVATVAVLFRVVALSAVVMTFLAVKPKVQGWVTAALACLALAESWTLLSGTQVFDHVHPSPWGNVGTVSGLPTGMGVALGTYGLVIATLVVLLFRSWLYSVSDAFRRATLRTLLVIASSALGSACYQVVGWRLGGLPQVSGLLDVVGISAALGFLLHYRHLVLGTHSQWSELLELNDQPTLLLNAEAVVTGANRAARELWKEQSELAGKHLLSLFEKDVEVMEIWRSRRHRADHVGCQVGDVPGFLTLHVVRDRLGTPLRGAIVVRPLHDFKLRAAAYSLSPREEETLVLLLQGHSARTAAERMFISEGTAKVHMHHVFSKSGVRSRAELFQKFLRPGLAPKTDDGTR